jgi:hypothetical protein
MTVIAVARLGMAGNLAGFGLPISSGLGAVRLRRELTPEVLEEHRREIVDLAARIDQATADHDRVVCAILNDRNREGPRPEESTPEK